MQRGQIIPPPPPKKSKTPIIICALLIILLAYSASINLGINNQISELKQANNEMQQSVDETQASEQAAKDAINSMINQFLLVTQENQTTMSEDYIQVDHAEIVENYIELFIYSNDVNTIQRYYFPSQGAWATPTIISELPTEINNSEAP